MLTVKQTSNLFDNLLRNSGHFCHRFGRTYIGINNLQWINCDIAFLHPDIKSMNQTQTEKINLWSV